MNNPLFEQIDNAGLTINGTPNIKAVSKMTALDIIEFAAQSRELTLAQNIVQKEGLLTHTASFSLGGSSYPCSEIMCRVKKAQQLAQFAAFYSDRIYIHNFIADHLRHLEGDKYPNEAMLKYTFANDLIVLDYLRPLIEAEIIVPVTSPHHCPNCFVREILHHDTDKRLASAIERLADRYAKELTYTLYRDKDGLINLVMEGPDDLLEHSYLAIITSDQPPRYYKHLRKQLNQGLEVRLPRKVVEQMGLDLNMTNYVFQNIVFELAVAKFLNTSYVTERPIDIAMLNDITTENRIQQRSRIIRDNLMCLVPFINNISAIDVLKLREAEQEAFIRFRQSLNKALNESLTSNREFGANEARQVYQDIIRPELSNLDGKMKHGYKNLFRDTAFEVFGWSAAIGIGLYTGIVPDALAPAAKALGFTKVLAELFKGILNKSHPESEIKDADMYFLWKVQQGVRQ
jgi:hypothetical protein